MKRLWMIVIALLVSCSLVVAQADHSKHGGKTESKGGGDAAVKQAIQKMEKELREGNVKGDPSAMQKYLADDFYSVSSANGQMYSKQQLIDRLKSGAAKYQSIDGGDPAVEMYGPDLAISHGEADVKVNFDGKDMAMKVHFARTWAKRNGKWQSIWFQTTRVQ